MRCGLGAAPERCRNGMIHTNVHGIPHAAVRRRAARAPDHDEGGECMAYPNIVATPRTHIRKVRWRTASYRVTSPLGWDIITLL